jgi:hypothetical protein
VSHWVFNLEVPYRCLIGFSTSKFPKISCKLNWVQAIKNPKIGRTEVKMIHSERVVAIHKLAPPSLTVMYYYVLPAMPQPYIQVTVDTLVHDQKDVLTEHSTSVIISEMPSS